MCITLSPAAVARGSKTMQKSPSLRQDGDPASLVVSVLSWIDLVVIFIGKFCLNHLARELILARTLC